MDFAGGSRICYSTDPPAMATVWANPILESLSLSINDQEQKKKVHRYSSAFPSPWRPSHPQGKRKAFQLRRQNVRRSRVVSLFRCAQG